MNQTQLEQTKWHPIEVSFSPTIWDELNRLTKAKVVDAREVRYVLTAVRINIKPTETILTGTNGVKLLELVIPMISSIPETELLISINDIKHLIKTFRKSSTVWTIKGSEITIANEVIGSRVRQLTDKYVEYEELLYSGSATVVIDRKAVVAALYSDLKIPENWYLYIDKLDNYRINFNRLRIPVNLQVNAKYLYDLLSHMKTDMITMRYDLDSVVTTYHGYNEIALLTTLNKR